MVGKRRRYGWWFHHLSLLQLGRHAKEMGWGIKGTKCCCFCMRREGRMHHQGGEGRLLHAKERGGEILLWLFSACFQLKRK